jgi:hypothetical protein
MAGDFPDLPDPSSIRSTTRAQDALGLVFTAVSEANQVLLDQSGRSRDSYSGFFGATGGLPEKLKKWLAKLHETLKKIVHQIPDALSFSITVGTTISVTVSFAKP